MRQAVGLLLRVPLVVHLEALVSQLANLKYYEVSRGGEDGEGGRRSWGTESGGKQGGLGRES